MTKTPEQMAKEYVNQEQLEYDEAGGAYYGFLAGYQAAKPQWISVKERLPEEYQEVLVSDNNVVSIKSISFFTHKWHPYENGFNCEPSHWMPLPEAPKEEK